MLEHIENFILIFKTIITFLKKNKIDNFLTYLETVKEQILVKEKTEKSQGWGPI